MAVIAAWALAVPASANAEVIRLRGTQSSAPAAGTIYSLAAAAVSQEPNQVWVVNVVAAANAQATAVTYRGQAFTRQVAQTSAVGHVEIWTLSAPNTTAPPGSVTVALSAPTPLHLEFGMYAGTHRLLPIIGSGAALSTARATSGSLAFPSASRTSDLLLGVLAGADGSMAVRSTHRSPTAPPRRTSGGATTARTTAHCARWARCCRGGLGAGFAWNWSPNSSINSPYAIALLGLRAPDAPVVAALPPSNVTQTSAALGGFVQDDGMDTVTARGVVMCPGICTPELDAPGVSEYSAGLGAPGSGFTITATGLTHTTRYTFRTFAINGGGIGYSSPTQLMTVANRRPQADAGGIYTIDEGQPLTLQGSAADADGDSLAVDWDLDGDGEYDDASGATPIVLWPRLASIGLDGPDALEITMRVSDNRTAPVLEHARLLINNLPPTGVLAGPPSWPEGREALIGFFAPDDPSAADAQAGIRYGFDFDNDGRYEVGSNRYATASTSPEATVSADFLADGPMARTIRGVMIDRDGGVTTRTLTIDVVNVLPSFTLADKTVPETDGVVTVDVTDVVDPGDPVRFAYDLDGQPGYEIGSLEYANASTRTSVPLPAGRAADGPGSFTIDAVAVDEDGALSLRRATLTVENVAPSATLTGSTAVEGSPAAVSFTGASDPSPADQEAGFTYKWDVDGDGTFTPGGATATVPAHDGPATVTVAGEISDRDGAGRRYTTTVQFTNAPPKAVITGPTEVAADGLVTLEVDVTDPGGDPVTALLDWGDGSTQLLAAGHSTVQHVYRRPGAQVVAVVPRDDEGAFGATASFGVSVGAPPPVIEAPKPVPTPVPVAPAADAPEIDQAISGVRLTPSCLRERRLAVRFVLELAGEVEVSLTKTSSKRPRTCPRPRGTAPSAGHRIAGVYTPRAGHTADAREGANTLTVAATGRNGKRLAPGTYRLRIRADDATADTKLVVLAP